MKFKDDFLESNKNRVLGLDIVRSIAIMLVVCGHGVELLPKSFQEYYDFLEPSLDGVSIFFVLSGFLIGGILLKTIQKSSFTLKDLSNFWIRRWFRTLPNYFFVLLCLVSYDIIIRQQHTDFNFKYFLFLQNFSFPHPSFFPEAWSLCIEEWFYFLFPIVCFILFKLLKNKSKSVLYSALFFLFLPFFMRLFCYVHGIGVDNWDENYRKVVVVRLDSLMYGIIGAYIYKFKNELWSKYKIPCLAASLIVVFCITLYSRIEPNNVAYLCLYSNNVESLATLFMLPYFSELTYSRFKLITFLFTFVSVTSYSMYLLNYSPILHHAIPITLSVVGLKGNTWEYLFVLKFFMYWGYVLVGSFVLYKYFEKPVMNLRDKIKLTIGTNQQLKQFGTSPL